MPRYPKLVLVIRVIPQSFFIMKFRPDPPDPSPHLLDGSLWCIPGRRWFISGPQLPSGPLPTATSGACCSAKDGAPEGAQWPLVSRSGTEWAPGRNLGRPDSKEILYNILLRFWNTMKSVDQYFWNNGLTSHFILIYKIQIHWNTLKYIGSTNEKTPVLHSRPVHLHTTSHQHGA